jgi:hypothetical protein
MTALCKKYYRIGEIDFFPNQFYEYKIEIHYEVGIKIYFVGTDEHPMLSEIFEIYFDDLQQRREDKLNQILNDIK